MNRSVSICVPTYNGECYLAEAVESALSQQYGDIEILVIDDCSSDGTVELVREYAKTDRRIRLLSNEKNLGLVANWNRCILEARGDWIKFLFQDDVLEPECVDSLLREAQEARKPLVACFRDFIFEDGIEVSTREDYLQQRSEVAAWYASPRLSAEEFCTLLLSQPPRNLVGEPTVALFRRDLAVTIGLFDPLLVHLCDAEYWSRIATRHGIAVVTRPLAKFRVHASSTTAENASIRRFRSESLDPIVLMYRYLFDDFYAALRKVMVDCDCSEAWRVDFWSRCAYSRAFSNEQQARGLYGPLKDWQFLIEHLPTIGDRPLRPMLRRIMRELTRGLLRS